MKIKLWLYPLILIVSVVMIIISLCVPFFQYVIDSGSGSISTNYTIWANYAGDGMGLGISGYASIWATLSLIFLLVGAVGLIASLILTILKLAGVKVKNYKMWNTISAFTALIGTVAFVVFSMLFTIVNHTDSAIVSGAFTEMAGTTGLFIAMAGLIIGTLASFLSANDLVPSKSKKKRK